LATATTPKAIYVIGKQLVTIFNIAHTIGIVFYAIDYALTLGPACQETPKRISANNLVCWLNSSQAYSPIL
jgi:hypothetical protein